MCDIIERVICCPFRTSRKVFEFCVLTIVLVFLGIGIYVLVILHKYGFV